MSRVVFSFLVILTISLVHNVSSVNINEFLAQRERLLAEESFRILGGSVTLNADEQLVNNMLMTAKTLEFDQSFSTLDFIPVDHYFLSKPAMLQSEVFQFIRQMPKGNQHCTCQ
jgi:hypothetical protein